MSDRSEVPVGVLLLMALIVMAAWAASHGSQDGEPVPAPHVSVTGNRS